MADTPPIKIKYVTGTAVFMDESSEAVISVGYCEMPGTHHKKIVGSYAATISVAESYCRQLMKCLGIKEDTRGQV